MKHRFQGLGRTSLTLAAMGAALALAACAGSSGSAGSASDAGGASGAGGASSGAVTGTNGRHRMAEALMSIGLSDAQKTQIRDIMNAARKQSEGLDPMTRRANYRAAMAKVDALLTPDQRTKLHEKLGRMRGQAPQTAPSAS